MKYLQTHDVIQKKIEFIDIYIDESFDIQQNKLSSKVERRMNKRSCLTITTSKNQLVISKIALCKGSSYIPLPKEIKSP